MNERLSDIEKHILNDLCMPVYTRDGSETSHPLVRPLTRQMPNIDSGIPPTEAPPDTVDELAAMQKLAGIGY